MELFYFIYGIEEDKYLKVLFLLLVYLLKDGANYVFVHLCLTRHDFEVISDPLQGQLLTYFLLHYLTYVEFYHIFIVLLIEIEELFLHCGWASHQIGFVVVSYLQNLAEGGLILLEYVINLIHGYEFAVVKVEVASLVSIDEGFRHDHHDIPRFMSLLVHPPNCKVEFLWFLVLPVLLERFKYPGQHILKNVGLHNNDTLRFEYLIFHDLSLAAYPYLYNTLSSATETPGWMALRIGTIKDMVLPEPLGALIRTLNFLRSGLTVTSRV